MPARPRRRPWVLALASAGAGVLGLTGAWGGWNMVALYRTPVDPSLIASRLSSQADRQAVVAHFQAFLAALDAAKGRGWPLAVAALVLGTAIVVAAIRTFGGHGGARVALVQLVVVQAGVHLLSYWLLRDVFEAELRFFETYQAAVLKAGGAAQRDADEMARAAARFARPIDLGLRCAGSLLVVIGLTTRRSREFVESAGAAVGQR